MPKAPAHHGQNEPQKRRRIVISCTECHRRKQKCDRQCPCCNCIRREKQHLCHFEPAAHNSRSTLRTSVNTAASDVKESTIPAQEASFAESALQWDDGKVEKSLQGFGYSSLDKHNSPSLLRATEICGDSFPNRPENCCVDGATIQDDKHEKYIELVRRLPSQTIANALVRNYFERVNWQYDLIDKDMFRDDLGVWCKVSYKDLQADLAAIAPSTLVFPALLFQVLAQALLFHSPGDRLIDGLLTMPSMTYHDLAADYSSVGAALVELFDKAVITISVVQAGLLHASYLKSGGKVVESWHVLGATIRNAQEIGLHSGHNIHEQHLNDTGEGKHRSNAIVHKIWMVLHIWDAHMAVVLGRSMATNLQLDSFAYSIGVDEDRRELLSHWQNEEEPPRPFDVIMAGYTVAYRYFQDIHLMEHRDKNAEHDLTVKQIHAAIMSNLVLLPSWCRLENPSKKFDAALGCQWLPAAREGLHSLIHLVILALHRPYIFSDAESRAEALKAGTSILAAQERLFKLSRPHEQHLFTPVYHSFDAIVLIAAICLVFPNEDRDKRAECVQAIARAVERLETVGRFNDMARSAHGIASSLSCRLMHRCNISSTTASSSNAPSSSEGSVSDSRTVSSDPEISNFSFETLPPPQPIHDFFYEHLATAQTTNGMQEDLLMDPSLITNLDDWNFEGDFSDESFWSMLNGMQ